MSSRPETVPEIAGAVCIHSSAIQQMLQLLPMELFYGVVEQSSVAISITDAQANILYCNTAFCRLTGYKKGEVQYHNHNILASQKTPRSRYESMWNALTQRRPWSGRLVNKRKDGSLYLAELTVTPVVDQQNGVTHYLGMHRDISDQFQLEQRVANQKALIESVLDAAPNPIAVLNEQNEVILDNLAYKTLRTDLRGIEPLQILGLQGTPTGMREQESLRSLSIRGQQMWFSVVQQPLSELNEEATLYFGQGKRPCQLLMITDQTARRQQIEQSRIEELRVRVEEATLVSSMREILDVAIFQGQAPLNMLQAALRLEPTHAESERTRLAISSALQAGEQALQRLSQYRPAMAEEDKSLVSFSGLYADLLDMKSIRTQSLHLDTDLRIEEGLPDIWIQRIRLLTALDLLFDKAAAAAAIRNSKGRVALCAYSYEQEIFMEVHDNGEPPRETATHRLLQPDMNPNHSQNALALQFAQNLVSDYRGSLEVLVSYLGGSCLRLRLPITALRERSQ